jgi:AcrR family transcriptional regulator
MEQGPWYVKPMPERAPSTRRRRPAPLARRDPESRRRLLLIAATRQFAELGYDGTSVNHVAKEAGVAVGTLFKYFPDKAALLEAVLADFEREFVAAITDPALHTGAHAARLGPLMIAMFQLAGRREHFYWALTSGTQALRGKRESHPGDAMRQAIATFIRSGMAAGEFRDGDPSRLAVLGYGIVEAAMRQCFAVENGRHAKAWARLTADVLLRTVLPAPR